MAAGFVYHDFTTASGVTFTVAKWVPDTSAPNVGAIPAHLLTGIDGRLAKILAPSTAPVAADEAVVVALSPNGLNANGPAAASAAAPSVISSRGKAPLATFTPAAAVYGAGDTMDVAKEFTGIGLAGDAIRVLSTELMISHTAIISGETNYRLEMYGVTPPSARVDNDAWALASGDRASYLGYLDLGTPVVKAGTLYVEVKDQNKDFILTGTSIFGELVTVGGFTATAAARKVTLHTTPV